MLLDLRHSRSMCKGSKKDDLFYTVIYFYVICSCQTLLKLFNWLRSYKHTHIAQRHKPYFLRKPWLFPCRKHGLFLRSGMRFGKASQSRSVILWSFSGRYSKAFQQLSLRYWSMSDLSPTSLVSSFCISRSPPVHQKPVGYYRGHSADGNRQLSLPPVPAASPAGSGLLSGPRLSCAWAALADRKSVV